MGWGRPAPLWCELNLLGRPCGAGWVNKELSKQRTSSHGRGALRSYSGRSASTWTLDSWAYVVQRTWQILRQWLWRCCWRTYVGSESHLWSMIHWCNIGGCLKLAVKFVYFIWMDESWMFWWMLQSWVWGAKKTRKRPFFSKFLFSFNRAGVTIGQNRGPPPRHQNLPIDQSQKISYPRG